ncbi:GSCOCG00003809001-RA-CDS [Cotesia congregata]|nr:GSCOCG00003809001-RA-CDS [Cotesia congregata]
MVCKLVIFSLFAVAIIQVSPRAITDTGREWLTGFMAEKIILVPNKIMKAASPDQINHMIAEVAKMNMTFKPVNEMTRTDFAELQQEIITLLNHTIEEKHLEE